MNRIHNGANVIFVVLLLVLISQTVFGEDKQFGVDSYIPELFTDTEWIIDGNMRISGNDSEDEFDGELDDNELMTVSDRDTYSDNQSLSSYFRYQYETIPFSFISNSSISLSHKYRSNESSYNRHIDYNDGHKSNHESFSDNNGRDFTIRLNQSIETGKYILSDWFSSIRGFISFTYYRNPSYFMNSREIEITTDTNNYINTRVEESHEDTGVENKSFSSRFEILTGWGRVYQGIYAATALYMIDELKNKGFTTREPSFAEMNILTDIIYQYKLKHSIDNRIHRIETMSAIVDYLKSNGIINQTDPNAQAIIQDIWDYFPRNSRRFGFKVHLGIGHNCQYSNRKYTEIDESYRLMYQYHIDTANILDTLYYGEGNYHRNNRSQNLTSEGYLTMFIAYYKPLSTKWQFNAYTSCNVYLKPTNIEERYEIVYPSRNSSMTRIKTTTRDYGYLTASALATYIKDTRTEVIFGFSYYQRRYKKALITKRWNSSSFDNSDTESHKYKSNGFNISANVVYRISIPTTLNAGIGYYMSSTTNNENQNERNRYELHCAISHHIL